VLECGSDYRYHRAMWRVVRDVVLLGCAIICAGTSVYFVYNLERFKRLYELQILNQPERDPATGAASNPLRPE
jgi:hypothetical protein